MLKRFAKGLLLAAALPFFSACDSGGQPTLGATENRFDAIARAVVRNEDMLEVQALADRIIKQRADFELIDIRSKQDYDSGHIKGARHTELTELVSTPVIEGLPGDRAIVVYSSDTGGAAQASTLLRLAGLDAYALRGGYRAWKRYMEDPEGRVTAGLSAPEKARRQAIACYFEGDYLANAGLVPKRSAYVPALEPVPSGSAPDPLGLGLGLGLGTDEVKPAQAPTGNGGLGLGLGLGLGTTEVQDAASHSPSPGTGAAKRGGLIIGEGC